MHQFLAQLLEDHRRIRGLLAAFEQQLLAFERAGVPDFDVLEFGINYCVEYLDAVHHRKEEQLLDRLRVVDPAAAVPMANLSRQHHDIEILTREVADAFGLARDGPLQSREELVTAGRNLLDHYRHHLSWEEAILFPTLRRALSHTDCDRLAANWQAAAVDPLDPAAQQARPAALLAAMEALFKAPPDRE